MSALTFEQAKNKLENISKDFILVEYKSGSNTKSIFIHKPSGNHIEYQYGSLLYKLKNNPKFVPRSKRLTLYKAKRKLQNITSDYELVEFVSGKKSLSLFYDKKRQRYTWYNFNNAIQCLKRNPKYILNPTKEEISQIRRKGIKSTVSSNISTYGVKYTTQIPYVKEKIEKTRKKKGLTKTIKGKTIPALSKESGLSVEGVRNRLKNLDSYENVESILVPHKTNIELKMSKFLDSLSIPYVTDRKLKGTNYRPDFFLKDLGIIIECDGNYWHSDIILPGKNYHVKKKKIYDSLGYTSFFFREDEILYKFHIIKSIILNSLGYSNRIFARKCSIIEKQESNYFKENHLMGPGQGKCFSLKYEGNIVASIQMKWVNKKEGLLEISRFCPKLGHSIVGGFSKLLAHVEKIMYPTYVQTFIDRRYGVGSYLENLGFCLETCYPSFKWTNGKSTYHRTTFLGNLGYDKGYYKLWDCGQAKYKKSIGDINEK